MRPRSRVWKDPKKGSTRAFRWQSPLSTSTCCRQFLWHPLRMGVSPMGRSTGSCPLVQRERLAACGYLNEFKYNILKIQVLSHRSHIPVLNSHRWLTMPLLDRTMQTQSMVIITESSIGQRSSRGPFNLSFLPVTK